MSNLMCADLDDRTERTICSTTCVECGIKVDWPTANLVYPLCPDCDCLETVQSIRPTAIHAHTITLIPIG